MTAEPDVREIACSDAVAALLRRCGLPASDISEAAAIVWLGTPDETAPRGVIALQPVGRSALLRSLAVAPDRRHAGLGARLIAAAEDTARAMGVETLYLLTEDADPYMARHGYREVARDTVPAGIQQLPQFTGVCPDNARCMVKSLSERTLPA